MHPSLVFTYVVDLNQTQVIQDMLSTLRFQVTLPRRREDERVEEVGLILPRFSGQSRAFQGSDSLKNHSRIQTDPVGRG